MRRFGFVTAGAVALTLAACGGADTAATDTASVPVAAATSTAPSPPPAPPAPPVSRFATTTKVSTDDYDFTYSIPSDVARTPTLVAWFTADRDAAQASVKRDAAIFRKDATANDFPFRKYESTTQWKRVAATPRFLSLSAETYDYTGGAHGSPGFRSVVWDRAALERLEVGDVFTSQAATQSAIGAAFCDALDVQRAKRRGTPVVRGTGNSFDDCPKVSETTVILGSSDGRAIDRIGLLVGPYVAGPYAEGSYDLTLPVTPALLYAVKPGYRGAFATRG